MILVRRRAAPNNRYLQVRRNHRTHWRRTPLVDYRVAGVVVVIGQCRIKSVGSGVEVEHS